MFYSAGSIWKQVAVNLDESERQKIKKANLLKKYTSSLRKGLKIKGSSHVRQKRTDFAAQCDFNFVCCRGENSYIDTKL